VIKGTYSLQRASGWWQATSDSLTPTPRPLATSQARGCEDLKAAAWRDTNRLSAQKMDAVPFDGDYLRNKGTKLPDGM
jgi:hypothetical protein